MASTAVIEREEVATMVAADCPADCPAAASTAEPPVSVEERANTITGYLNAQHAALVDVVVELLANPLEWQGEGVWTMPQWLAWRCGVSSATAHQITDIAQRADDLPRSIQAFRDGELSLDQMTAIARRAPWWTDQQIVELGRMLTVSQLQRTLREYPFPNLDEDGRELRDEPSDEPEDQEPAREPDAAAAPAAADADATAGAEEPIGSATGSPEPVDEWCSFTFGDDGVFRLHLTADYDTGHLVQSALTEARDRLFQDGQHDVDWVDSLREVCNRSLDGVADPDRRSRFRVNLYLDTDATAADAAGWVVPDSIRRHLTCDGLVSPVFVESGVPVSVGRSQRIVPARTRTVVEQRDGHRCRVPGCTASVWLETHHIIHWEHHGETETWNLLLLCRRHHRDHHRGRLGITGDADLPPGAPGAVEFTNRHGRRISPSGASPTPPSGPPPTPASVYEHPLGERLQSDCVSFQPPLAHQAELNERITRDRAAAGNPSDLRWSSPW